MIILSNKKEINRLVKLYFECNPHMNRGLGFRIKAYDIISSYINKHNMSYSDVELCIESNKMYDGPIWDMFYNYWFNNKNNKIKNKSSYKNTIGDSTDVNDWL